MGNSIKAGILGGIAGLCLAIGSEIEREKSIIYENLKIGYTQKDDKIITRSKEGYNIFFNFQLGLYSVAGACALAGYSEARKEDQNPI